MKLFSRISFFALFTVIALSSFGGLQDKGSLVATYQGINDNGEYAFKDDKGKVVVFGDITADTELDLGSDELIGAKMNVSWELVDQEVFSDDDDTVGKIVKVKVISGIELVE